MAILVASINASGSNTEAPKYKYTKKVFAEGGTSLLYKCHRQGNSEIYIAKVLKFEGRGKLIKRFNVECEMLQRFKGKTHIIQVIDVLEDRITYHK